MFILHSGDNVFTPNGIESAKLGQSVYAVQGNKIIEDKVTDISLFTSKECIKLQTTSGPIVLELDAKVPVIEYGEFYKSRGYDKVINIKNAKDLAEGDLLITSFNGPELISTNEQCIDILQPVYESVTSKFEGYDVRLEEDQVTIYSTNGKKMTPYNRMMDAKSLLNIMAWYITEGFSSKQYLTNKQSSKFLSVFSQSLYKNHENNDNICADLQNLNIPISVTASKKILCGRPMEVTYQFNSCISALMQTAGFYSDEKHIPQWIMSFLIKNPQYINEFLITMIEGDGHFDELSHMYSYSTKSIQLAQQIAFLAKLIGFYVKYSKTKTSQHVLMFGSKNRKIGLVRIGNFASTKITKTEYCEQEQPAICVATEHNYNIFAGEFGNIMIGNSIPLITI